MKTTDFQRCMALEWEFPRLCVHTCAPRSGAWKVPHALWQFPHCPSVWHCRTTLSEPCTVGFISTVPKSRLQFCSFLSVEFLMHLKLLHLSLPYNSPAFPDFISSLAPRFPPSILLFLPNITSCLQSLLYQARTTCQPPGIIFLLKSLRHESLFTRITSIQQTHQTTVPEPAVLLLTLHPNYARPGSSVTPPRDQWQVLCVCDAERLLTAHQHPCYSVTCPSPRLGQPGRDGIEMKERLLQLHVTRYALIFTVVRI